MKQNVKEDDGEQKLTSKEVAKKITKESRPRQEEEG